MKKFIVFGVGIFPLFLISLCFSQSNLQAKLEILLEKEKQISAFDDSLLLLQKEINLPDSLANRSKMNEIERKRSAFYREILDIKAAIYEAEEAEPMWVEGEGEIILDDKKSYEQNKRLVQMFARRDAMEKGGNLLVETLTTLKKFEVSAERGSGMENKFVEEFRSIIQSKGKVQVIDQDLSADYDKVILVEEEGIKKLKTKVRLKIKSLDALNPFKEELKNY